IAPGRLRVAGKGLWGLREPDSILDCGNSGTGVRLLAGVLAGQDFFSIVTGDASIRRRPMGRVVGPLREMGAVIAGRRGGELAPLAIVGARLRGIVFSSPIASAQVKSSVLLAGLFADGTTSVTEPAQSRDHTERLFEHLGVPVTRNGLTVSLAGQRAFAAKDIARIAAMALELRRLGAAVEERPDGLRITGGRPLEGAVCQSHGDHRVAMSMIVAGLAAQGETRVEDCACVATSFPGFDKKLRGLLTPSGQG